MYAYLIDPFARTVTQVERTRSSSAEVRLNEIYKLIDCACVTAVRPENSDRDVFYVDDEGWIREDQAYFFCRLFPHQPFAGKALWTGTTSQGGDCDPRCTLDYVRAHIVWLDVGGSGLTPVFPLPDNPYRGNV